MRLLKRRTMKWYVMKISSKSFGVVFEDARHISCKPSPHYQAY